MAQNISFRGTMGNEGSSSQSAMVDLRAAPASAMVGLKAAHLGAP